MKVKELNVYASEAKACTAMLHKAFPDHYPKNVAKEEIIRLLKGDNMLYVAVENETVIGFVGTSKARRYISAFQLDLMVIKPERRGEGIGTKLLDIVEHRLRDKGVVTLFIGTDDEGYKTSLTGTNIYEDTFEKIESISSTSHPYQFYQKQGYQIVGVIPDAFGIGNHDIVVAKRLYEPRKQ